MKILITPDKFKGTLTARAAAEAIARGWCQSRPEDSLELLPMSDGGDGFGEVMGQLLGARLQKIKTVDAAHQRCEAHWWWQPKTKTAIIESASIIGLAKLPPGKFHPFDLDTFGLGAVMRAAAKEGATRCIVGIGGSATNDGGFGLARALDWKFQDRQGRPIERWTDLAQLARISPPKRRRWFRELIVAVDVQNPLLGARGATRVYGPQKGLRPAQFSAAEENLRILAKHAGRLGVPPLGGSARLKPELHTVRGAGAAGGLGFGLMVFLGAEAEPGFELFARFANLDKLLRADDLIITGEGCIDKSTFMGKGVGEVARHCRQIKVPCVLLAGNISGTVPARFAPVQIAALTDLTSSAAAKAKPALWLERLAARIARVWTGAI